MIENRIRPGRHVRPIAPFSKDLTAMSLLFLCGCVTGIFAGLIVRIIFF